MEITALAKALALTTTTASSGPKPHQGPCSDLSSLWYMMRIIPKELQAKRKMLEKAVIGLRFSQLDFAPVLLLEEFWVTRKAQEQKKGLDPGESFLAESFSPVTPAKFHLPRLNSVLPEPSGCGEAAAGGRREDETSGSLSYPLEQQILH